MTLLFHCDEGPAESDFLLVSFHHPMTALMLDLADPAGTDTALPSPIQDSSHTDAMKSPPPSHLGTFTQRHVTNFSFIYLPLKR